MGQMLEDPCWLVQIFILKAMEKPGGKLALALTS
jgi:hypothetical protein